MDKTTSSVLVSMLVVLITHTLAASDDIAVNLVIIFKHVNTTSPPETTTSMEPTTLESTADPNATDYEVLLFYIRDTYFENAISLYGDCALTETALNETKKEVTVILERIWLNNSPINASNISVPLISDDFSDCNYDYTVWYSLSTVDEGSSKLLDSIEESLSQVYSSGVLIRYGMSAGETKVAEANKIETISVSIDEQVCETRNCTLNTDVCYEAQCINWKSVCETNNLCNDTWPDFFSTDMYSKCSHDPEEGCFCTEDKDYWVLPQEAYFYSEGKCINTSLILLVGSSALGLILLALSITIGCLACSKNSYKAKNQELLESADTEVETFDRPESLAAVKQYELNYAYNEDEPQAAQNGSAVKGSKPGHSSKISPSQDSWMDEREQDVELERMMQTDAYRTFQPNLSNIDTSVQYQLRRPKLSSQPQSIQIRVTDTAFN